MAVVTATELRNWSGLLTTDQGESDTVLDAVIAGATTLLEQNTGTPIIQASTVEVVPGTGTDVLPLPYPLPAGETLSVEYREGHDDVWTDMASSDYEIRDNRLYSTQELHLLVLGTWPRNGEVRLTYEQAGYTSGTVPADIQAAILDLCSHRLAHRWVSRDARQIVARAAELPETVRRTIAGRMNYYRRRKSSVRLAR